jgi:hypothetical protein
VLFLSGKLDQPSSIAAYGDYAYICDSGNRRIVKARIKYQNGQNDLKYQEKMSPPLFLNLSDILFIPNPFASLRQNGAVYYTLNYDAEVTIRIFDTGGRLVRQYQARAGQPGGRNGSNSMPWDGRNGQGSQVNNGTYTVRIKAVSGPLRAETACRMTLRN